MAERLIFSMEVAHEMLRALWQVQYGVQIDDFPARRLPGGIFLSQKL